MGTLGIILEQRMKDKGLSMRAVARQTGVAHTTISRILAGEPADVDTLVAICNWLGISPASALNEYGLGTDQLAAQLSIILSQEPELARVFAEALARIQRGEADPKLISELSAYAAYRMQIAPEMQKESTK